MGIVWTRGAFNLVFLVCRSDSQEREIPMWPLSSILPRTLAWFLSVLLSTYVAAVSPIAGSVHLWGGGATPLAVIAPPVTFARTLPAAIRDGTPTVRSLTATPLRAAPLDTVTFTTTFSNAGVTRGPYSATLQLLPEDGGRPRSLSQSGFMLRPDQPLSLYWEWRADASLPPGRYSMRVQLATMAAPAHVLASYTSTRRLTIVSR